MFWRTAKHDMHCRPTHFLCTKRMIKDRTIGCYICHTLCWENECMYDFINIVNNSLKRIKIYLFCVKTGYIGKHLHITSVLVMHVGVKTRCDCRNQYKPIIFVLHVGLRNTSSEKENSSAVHSGWTIADITSIPRSSNPLDWRIEPREG